jgi:tetraacyldisaccharide 4'-kinase
MSLRSRLQPWFVSVWQRRGLAAWLLLPLTWLHRLARLFSRRKPPARDTQLPVPVVVVGNLYVGGTGKTPLTIELVRQLRARGWQPGIVSRGYGAGGATAREVRLTGRADDYGDEPMLLAQATGVPVVVGHDRLAAARLLLNLHRDVDLVVADDGLQHHRLGRDVEIALVHYRGFGNGWLLPAGPLRDPPERLAKVDAVVFHDQLDSPRPTVRVYPPFFSMRTEPGVIYALKDPERRVQLADLAAEQQRGRLRVIAMCGIGMPDRFFAMLRAAGLQFDALAFADHYEFHDNPLAGCAFDLVLVTEKDAVKCRGNPVLAADGRLCVVPLAVTLDSALIDLVESRLPPRSDAPAMEPSMPAPASVSTSAATSRSPTTHFTETTATQGTVDGPSPA